MIPPSLLLAPVLLPLFRHVSGAVMIQETKHGVIGLGIPMYKPVCCYACHDALSSLNLNCTTFSHGHMGMDMKLIKRMDMGGDSMAETTDECRASDPTWLATLAYCIHSRCTAEGADADSQDRCFQTIAANTLPVPNLHSCMPAQPPTGELKQDAEWLNTTSLVNDAAYADQRRTLDGFARSEEAHTRYGLVVWMLTIGIPILVGVFTLIKSNLAPKQSSSLSRKLNQYLFLPALSNGRQLQPLPYSIGYAPSRILSLFIFFYVSLNIIFCCVSYDNQNPNTWFSTSRDQTAAYVSNRTGVLSFANLGLAIAFSGRNNLLIALTGWSQTTFLTIHRWVSRVATVQAVVHSIIYTVTYFWSGGAQAYYAEAKLPYYWWGIIATVVMSVSVGFSVLPVRLRAYELFLITHIVLAILAIVGCWYHVDLRFNKRWGYEVWIYLAMAFWAFDRVFRFGRVLWYNEWTVPVASHVEKVPGSQFLQLTIFPGKRWVSSIGPGKHTFLTFPGKLWESHPFTIADWGFLGSTVPEGAPSSWQPTSEGSSSIASPTESTDEKRVAVVHESAMADKVPSDKGRFYIRILIRPHTGSTRSLLETFSSSPPSPRHLRILTEGPYAGHSQTLHPLKHADTVLCIAGGIGVTYSLGFIKQYLNQNKTSSLVPGRRLLARTTRFTLAWSAREEELIEHVTQKLIPADATRTGHLEVNVWHTKEQQMTGSEEEFAQEAKTISNSEGRSPSPSSPNKEYTNITSLTTGSRMPVDSVIRSVLEPSRRVAVLVCAPGTLADEVRRSVVKAVGDGFEVQLIEEAFAW
ncbi:hypothetical protein PV10_01802 [Exophiala mesophila]|uniref:FAD-binding FR-type domain-containing protein n=1 Tax=Exophiala mesophila TaxID=212818 RepID=A0A0D1ZUB0_EXOME|nr:uncharacterized protein PV10_01802 [Exophiala mesophila]KIV98122.1 hypothetical protein PV10_01802 [Exophiala mesophila]